MGSHVPRLAGLPCKETVESSILFGSTRKHLREITGPHWCNLFEGNIRKGVMSQSPQEGWFYSGTFSNPIQEIKCTGGGLPSTLSHRGHCDKSRPPSGSSSVGRALAFQAKGRGFESRFPLKASEHRLTGSYRRSTVRFGSMGK